MQNNRCGGIVLPEAVELGSRFFSVAAVTSIVAIGFLFYLCIDRIIQFTAPRGPEDIAVHLHDSHHRGTLGAAVLFGAVSLAGL